MPAWTYASSSTCRPSPYGTIGESVPARILPPPATTAFSIASYGFSARSSAAFGGAAGQIRQHRDDRQRKQRQPRIVEQRLVAGGRAPETPPWMPMVGVSVTPDFASRSMTSL